MERAIEAKFLNFLFPITDKNASSSDLQFVNLVEERESHVVVRLFLGFFLLLLLSSGSTTSGGTSGSGGSRGSTTTDVGDEVLNIFPLQKLGEETWPVWLNLYSSSLDDGGNLISLFV